MNQELTEEGDYYYNEKGLLVFTEAYLKRRGYCCGSGCINCPFEYEQVPEPKRSVLLLKKKNQQ